MAAACMYLVGGVNGTGVLRAKWDDVKVIALVTRQDHPYLASFSKVPFRYCRT